MSTKITVTPRADGDPQADVMGLLLAHRCMLRDLRRLSTLTRDIADGTTILSPGAPMRLPATSRISAPRSIITTAQRTTSSGR